MLAIVSILAFIPLRCEEEKRFGQRRRNIVLRGFGPLGPFIFCLICCCVGEDRGEDTSASLRTMGRAQRKKFRRDRTPGTNWRTEPGLYHFVCWHGDIFMKHSNNTRHYLVVHGWMKAIPNPVSLWRTCLCRWGYWCRSNAKWQITICTAHLGSETWRSSASHSRRRGELAQLLLTKVGPRMESTLACNSRRGKRDEGSVNGFG